MRVFPDFRLGGRLLSLQLLEPAAEEHATKHR